ncbi:MAG: tetratricopeptide repeat protein [Elusimicrobiota bacterium]|nr:tetratricopeptide repeat protein [Elusimicrobiota bacterium]
MKHSDIKTAAALPRNGRAASPGAALTAIAGSINGLLDHNRQDLAQKLAVTAVRMFPESPVLPNLLEKAMSCVMDLARVEKIYGAVLKSPRACPGHYYHLAMLYKRGGDLANMKRVFSDLLRRRGRAELIHIYIAACTLDKYGLAFETAERIIESPGRENVLSRLWNPWGDRSSACPAGFFPGRLARLERAAIKKELEHYRTFFRGVLLFNAGRNAAALREFGRLPDLPPGRYGWMRFPEGWARLYACDYRGALDAFRQSAKSEMSRVPSMGRMAEIHICTGRAALGFTELRKALKTAPVRELPGLHAWEGEMRLFTGDYRAALKALTKGAKLGDDVAFCWRGAAYAKLGSIKKALADLDKAVKLFPTDMEARVWRGEALRLAGKYSLALADLDRVIAARGNYMWAYFNRALVRHALGDNKGMKEDFDKIDGTVIRFLERELPAGGEGPAGPARMRRLLEEGCRLAMGNRRDDEYYYPIWMGNSRMVR